MEMPIKELKYWLGRASDICSKRDACSGCPFRFHRLIRDRRNEKGAYPEYYCCLDGSPYEWDVDCIGGELNDN